MDYVVTGASRETGRDVCITVEASDHDDAVSQANEFGIVVGQVKPKDAPDRVSAVDPRLARGPRGAMHTLSGVTIAFLIVIGSLSLLAGVMGAGRGMGGIGSWIVTGLVMIGWAMLWMILKRLEAIRWELRHRE